MFGGFPLEKLLLQGIAENGITELKMSRMFVVRVPRGLKAVGSLVLQPWSNWELWQ